MLIPILMTLEIGVFPSGPLQANCFVVYDKASKESVIIDPGDANYQVTKYIKQHQLTVKFILATHAHFDHVFGVGYFKHEFPEAKFCCHKDDAIVLQYGASFSSMFQIPAPANLAKVADKWFDDSFTFALGSTTFRTISTPGHSPGSACFYCEAEKVIFTGDTLFYGSIGRTDFPGSNPDDMRASIYKLEKEVTGAGVLLYPGHDTTGKPFANAIGMAKRMV